MKIHPILLSLFFVVASSSFAKTFTVNCGFYLYELKKGEVDLWSEKLIAPLSLTVTPGKSAYTSAIGLAPFAASIEADRSSKLDFRIFAIATDSQTGKVRFDEVAHVAGGEAKKGFGVGGFGGSARKEWAAALRCYPWE